MNDFISSLPNRLETKKELILVGLVTPLVNVNAQMNAPIKLGSIGKEKLEAKDVGILTQY